MLSESVQLRIFRETGQIPSNPQVNLKNYAYSNEELYKAYQTVLEAYRLAEEAFSWFLVAPMSFDPADSREVNGMTYYRVDQPGMDSTASLRGYLKGLFSDDLVESLLPYGGTQYIDLDGALYVQDGGRGTDIYRGGEFTQVLRGDDPNRLVVQVTVEVVDPEQDGAVTGTETHEFSYEKVGDRWIFTDFSLVH